jgi:hypothetical protein
MGFLDIAKDHRVQEEAKKAAGPGDSADQQN